MFCPKCGAQMPEETQLCSNCGCDISNIQQAVPSEKVLTMDGVQSVELERKSSPIRTIFFILATIVFALSLYWTSCKSTIQKTSLPHVLLIVIRLLHK